jgi:hypothetical protein
MTARMLRSLAALALSLMLALTAGAFAVARGQGAVAGWAEICTGSGPVMLARDAEGNPTGGAHICPDAALFLSAGGPAALPPRAAPAPRRVAAAAEPLRSGRAAPAPRARDPPPAV